MRKTGGISHYLIFTAILLITLGAGKAWGQVSPEQGTLEQAVQEQAKPQEQPKPEKVSPIPEREKPGYFPTILFPTYYGIVQAGPKTGLLAPYGNPYAFDTLRRGWVTHGAGPLLVTPYLEYDGLYRSNIYLSPTNPQSDYINAVTPGVEVELPFGGLHRLSMGYLGQYWMYSDHTEESHYDHNANIDAEINFRGGLSLRGGDAFRAATEERTTETGRRRPYLQDTPYFLASYNVSEKTKIQATYQYDIWQYDRSIDQIDNYRNNLAGLFLFYKFLPRTSALAGYVFSSRVYPSYTQDNNIQNSPFIGLTWDPTTKLTGNIKFGYTFQNYENHLPGRNNSPNSWAFSLGSIYRYSRYTTLNLSAQRSIQQDIDFANATYYSTALWVSLTHDWAYFRVASYVSFAYANSSYVNSGINPSTGLLSPREDNTYTIGAGVSRPLTPWLRLRLDYNYTDDASSYFLYSYHEHRVLLGVQLSL
jgi:hypothetical protein